MITIGIVGAGRLGTSFGLFMHGKGNQVIGYYSRNIEHARKGASLIGDDCKAFVELSDIIGASDWIVISTVDDAIPQIVKQIQESHGNLQGKIVFHMSGAATSDALTPLCHLGAEVASLHPLQTFTDPIKGAEALEKAYFSLEGTPFAVAKLKEELHRLHLRYFIITAAQKPLYHAAASIASNSLVAVVDYSLKLMEGAGIERGQALEALRPLIVASIHNCLEKGPEKSLTGPIVRGDVGTVSKHIEKIHAELPELLPDYLHLGKLTLETAQKEQLTDKIAIEEIKKLLFP